MPFMRAFFNTLPRWYLVALYALFVLYLCGWVYTVHLAQIERAEHASIVMPVGDHDSASYANLAQNLLHGRFVDNTMSEQYEYFHTPGYPVFAAVILFVTGGSFFAVTFAQLLLVFATALLLCVLGTAVASHTVGPWASLLFLCNPLVPNIVFIVGTDTLFTFLLTLAFTLLVIQFSAKPFATAVIVGIVFAAAVYVRPVGFLAIPIFIAPLVATNVQWKQKILYGAVMLLILGALLVPWMLRNKAHSGVFSFSSLFALNMAYYEIPHYLSWHSGTIADGVATVQKESGVPEGIDFSGYPTNWYNLMYTPPLDTYIYATVFAHPISYAVFHLYNSTGFFLNPAVNPSHQSINLKQLLAQRRYAELFRAALSPWWLALERIGIFMGLLLLATGFWILRRKSQAWVFAFIILYMAALGGVSAASRLRLPVEPLISIFITASIYAAYGMVTKIKTWHEK
jgi:4-amino-4-deoxy-L-arabinose transferase-like glycosyltransferase